MSVLHFSYSKLPLQRVEFVKGNSQKLFSSIQSFFSSALIEEFTRIRQHLGPASILPLCATKSKSAAWVKVFTNRTNYPFLSKDSPLLLFLQLSTTAMRDSHVLNQTFIFLLSPPVNNVFQAVKQRKEGQKLQ